MCQKINGVHETSEVGTDGILTLDVSYLFRQVRLALEGALHIGFSRRAFSLLFPSRPQKLHVCFAQLQAS